ncbi:MAG: T9SS type A sorting domain-containing protein [Ferruginibacter sp.]
MKHVLISVACLYVFTSLHAQGITLLYKNDMGWNDRLSWVQINTPSGQTPIQRVPTELDDVVVSNSLSGLPTVGFLTDIENSEFFIGSNNTTGYRCKSMHISNTDVSFVPTNYIRGASVDVYTSNGGFVILDSGSNISYGIFQLHGGNPLITDLQIINSTFGILTDYIDNTEIYMDVNSKARLVGSTYGGMFFGGGSLFAQNSTINTDGFTLGDNSTDTILNSTIQDVGLCGCLSFLIGRNANFVSSDVIVRSNSSLGLGTSGSTLNGNVSILHAGSGFAFLQEDSDNPLPTIINGNLLIPEIEALGFNGDVKISGDFIFKVIDEILNDPPFIAPVIINGQHVFDVGGITNYGNTLSINDCANNYCHYKLEFFGNTNSNISWPGGFPVDTLIINKTGCAKVTIDSSLYVSGATRIESGQLVLNPNDNYPYKFVCAGNVVLAQGGGLFLRRNAAGVAANMAIGGTLTDHNSSADSTCAGLSSPYNGTVTFYNALLPVTLLDFYGQCNNRTVDLTWSTANEINTKYFTIEKSFNQVSFIPLTNVAATGNMQSNKNYQYIDNTSLRAINYYRLKMVDADGLFTYSKIIAIAAPGSNAITIFPNPVKDKLFIMLPGLPVETELTIADAKGSCVKKLQLKAGTTETSINTVGFAAGVYSISFQSGSLKNTQQFIKQ